jgi:hypothetical protein
MFLLRIVEVIFKICVFFEGLLGHDINENDVNRRYIQFVVLMVRWNLKYTN